MITVILTIFGLLILVCLMLIILWEAGGRALSLLMDAFRRWDNNYRKNVMKS